MTSDAGSRNSVRRPNGPKAHWLGWLATACAAVLAAQPLWGALPRGHDTLLHLYRIPVLNAMWRQGALFSRWSPNLMLGYGYPLFTFYPPLSAYLIGVLYWLVGQSAPVAVAAAFALSIVAAGAGMYLVGRRLFGPVGGALAATAYLLSPHLLYQTYHRGSISNSVAAAFFPLAVWALLRYLERPGLRRVVLPALMVAGVLVSHAAASLVFMPALAILGLVMAWRHRVPATGWAGAGRALLRLAVPLASGLGLAAFFWMPALLNVDNIQYGAAVAAGDVHWSLHFADLLAWPSPAVDGLANPPLPQSVGVVVLILGVLGAARAVVGVTLSRRAGEPPSTTDLLTIGAGVIGLGSALVASPASSLLWESSRLLRSLQFPWRGLDSGAFCISLAAGRLVYGHRRPLAQAGVLVIALGALTLNALPYMAPPRFYASPPTHPTLAEAGTYQASFETYGLTSWGEYLPDSVTWVPEAPLFPGADEGAGLHEKLDREALPTDALLAATGDPWRATLELSLDQPERLTLHTYWFPGWRATIDGAEASIGPDERGLLTIAVPAGQHRVEVRWRRTPFRAFADGLSSVAAAILLAAAIWPRGKGAPTQAPAQQVAAHATYSPVPLLAIGGALLILLAGKTAVLDRTDSPLLRHVNSRGLRGVAVPPWARAGDGLRLVGYDIEADGQMALYWQTLAGMEMDYITAIDVSDMRGVPVATSLNTHPGLSLTSRWEPGDLVRDVHEVHLPHAEHPIAYRLSVQILHPDTQEPLAWLDAPAQDVYSVPITVMRVPGPEPTGQEVGRAVGVLFGDAIELERAALPTASAAGQPVAYTLVWRAYAPVAHDYTVFVHLLDAEGQLVANDDGQPLGALFPTSVWEPGEIVSDIRALPADLPPGDYRVEVGLYRLDTGERLATGGTEVHLGDRVQLGTLTVH